MFDSKREMLKAVLKQKSESVLRGVVVVFFLGVRDVSRKDTFV